MVVNLTAIDRILREEVDVPLDHRNLNRDVPEFSATPPTAENVALWIWRRVASRVRARGLALPGRAAPPAAHARLRRRDRRVVAPPVSVALAAPRRRR